MTGTERPPPAHSPASAPVLPGSVADRVLHIANRRGGQVIEVTVADTIRSDEWPALQARLELLIRIRQPRELHLDPEGTGGFMRFPDGLEVLADALAMFGGTLVTGTDHLTRGG